MASRYGRNKRREHRNKIAELEESLSRAKTAESKAMSAAFNARLAASNAKEIALRDLVNKEPMIKAAMQEMGYELTRTMGPKYQEHVQRLMDMDRNRRPAPLVSFDAKIHYDKAFKTSYIEGRIEALAYRIAIPE